MLGRLLYFCGFVLPIFRVFLLLVLGPPGNSGFGSHHFQVPTAVRFRGVFPLFPAGELVSSLTFYDSIRWVDSTNCSHCSFHPPQKKEDMSLNQSFNWKFQLHSVSCSFIWFHGCFFFHFAGPGNDSHQCHFQELLG